MDEFKGKTAVITGAGSGIGRALATQCAREGMQVALADLQASRLETLVPELEALGSTTLALQLDVSDASAVEDFAQQCLSTLGVPDLLFNNAGILRIGETWTQASGDWSKLLSINLMGVVHGINAFLPAMIERQAPAHVINTGSVGSLVVAPGMAQYTASKMAVRGITESLAYDLAAVDAPIDVSLLCPGPVLTSISDELLGIEPGDGTGSPADHLMAGQPDFISAEECAARVFAGIRERRFWIFTHPFGDYLQEKTRDIAEGRNPVYSEVEFDAPE